MAVIAPRRTTAATDAAQARPGLLRTEFVRRVGHAALLLPVLLGTAGAVAAGRADVARRWWARSAGQGPAAPAGREGPGSARLLAHSLLCLPLGLLTLIPLGVQVLFVLRGMLYPVVQAGPYTTAWGGPSLAGAWLAHFGVGLLSAAVGLGVLWLLDRLHTRLAGGMWGRRVGIWPVLGVVASFVAGVMLVIAWTHQL
ncbi:hypothetical protein [Streptomyces sp. NPDC058157]|uniref:hypothetical protein n=1 Tax=Streptomyces sp. NPDC058157 TaxID=3346360 RepID=UPI0036EC5034